jgi:hypothetical protein
MPSQNNITNIPSSRVDFIDQRTGLMSREWYRFFLNLFNLTGAGNNPTSLDDLQVGPPAGAGGGGDGTVTSVQVSGGTTGLTTSGGPITSAGTITLAGTLAVANGGTGATTAAGARTNLGAGTVTSVAATAGTGISVTGSPITTSGTLNITNTAPDQTVVMTSGTGISVTGTYPNFTITNTSPSSGGTVTSVTGTSPVVSSGGTTPAISLASGYGDTQNPYASKTANYVLAAPNGSAGAPTFRALVSADIPALSYVSSIGVSAPITTTGGLTPTIGITQATTSTNGYLSSTDWNTFNNKQAAGTYVNSVSGTAGRITSTGGVTPVIDLASGIATPGTTGSSTLIPVVTVDTYGRVTSITTASNPQGTVTSVSGTGTVSGISLSGTVTSSGSLTLGGTLAVTPSNFSSQTANTFLAAPNGSAGTPTFRAIVAADVPTLNQNTTGTASNVTGTVAIANGGTGQTTAAAGFSALSPITTTGDLIIGNGTNSATRLPIGANTYVPTSNGTTATWAASTGGVTSFSAGTTGFTPSTATTGAVTLGGTLGISNGGTNQTSFTANYIHYGSFSTSASLQFDGTTMRVGSSALLGGTTNPIVGVTGTANQYIQQYIYNSNSGTSASADFVAYADNSTDSHGWADMGFTSSTYADSTYTVTGKNEAYLFGSAPSGAGATGNMVYATDSTGSANAHQFYVGGFTQAKSAWKAQVDSTGLKATQVNATNGFIVNSMTVSANYTIATGDSAMSVGPMTIASGVVITVSSGSRWVVI